jgi:signal transduction histidine kinase
MVRVDTVMKSITVADSTVMMRIYYDDSDIVQKLRWLPYVEIIIGAMFIMVGYISFSHIKRNEQSNIWVGMAKETAHQLGTPLSSLLGWIELLRLMPEDREQVLEAADEMQRDVERLNKVAHRFSKIGSQAELKVVEINAIITNVVGYFERRLPHLGKRVSLVFDGGEPVNTAINVDLFEWVFENLVRNAADAIDRSDGEIRFRVRRIRNSAVIDIKDNGRGVDPKVRKDIFRPGFSTKKRGWGLGLSLAKRIVEDYHGGKITLKDSSPKGTTFRIILDAAEPPEEVPTGTEQTEKVEA